MRDFNRRLQANRRVQRGKPHKENHMKTNAALKLSVVSSQPQPCTNTVQTIEITDRSSKGAQFIDLLSEGVSVIEACDRAGIPRRSVYARRSSDPTFRQQWDEALEMAADILEAEADRAAAMAGVRMSITGDRLSASACATPTAC